MRQVVSTCSQPLYMMALRIRMLSSLPKRDLRHGLPRHALQGFATLAISHSCFTRSAMPRFVFAGPRHAAGGQHLLTASMRDGIADSHAVVIAQARLAPWLATTCPARICHACHIAPLFHSLCHATLRVRRYPTCGRWSALAHSLHA